MQHTRRLPLRRTTLALLLGLLVGSPLHSAQAASSAHAALGSSRHGAVQAVPVPEVAPLPAELTPVVRHALERPRALPVLPWRHGPDEHTASATQGGHSNAADTGPRLRTASEAGAPWTHQATLRASAGAADGFGLAVALSADGNTALVGAPSQNSSRGAAYVFVRNSATWTQQAELTASDGVQNGIFGAAVALSADGNSALVGAPGQNSAHGAAYVFVRSHATWSQQTELTATDDAPDNGFDYLQNDGFGLAVALSADGSTALVGSPDYFQLNGAAWVFVRGATTWTQQAKLTGLAECIGNAVALDGNGSIALVGAEDVTNMSSAAYVFVRSGATWSRQAEISDSGGAQRDFVGNAVALSNDGTVALVTSPGRNQYAGAATFFARTRTHWTQQVAVTEPAAAAGDFFGNAAALTSNGSTALVSAPDHGNGQGMTTLIVRGAMTWTQQAEQGTAGSALGDSFGVSVALAGNGSTALVGSNTGAVYVFIAPQQAAGAGGR